MKIRAALEATAACTLAGGLLAAVAGLGPHVAWLGAAAAWALVLADVAQRHDTDAAGTAAPSQVGRVGSALPVLGAGLLAAWLAARLAPGSPVAFGLAAVAALVVPGYGIASALFGARAPRGLCLAFAPPLSIGGLLLATAWLEALGVALSRPAVAALIVLFGAAGLGLAWLTAERTPRKGSGTSAR
jgi:hypothetical protein